MPQNLSAQFVCSSPKVLDFNEKRLHWESVVCDWNVQEHASNSIQHSIQQIAFLQSRTSLDLDETLNCDCYRGHNNLDNSTPAQPTFRKFFCGHGHFLHLQKLINSKSYLILRLLQNSKIYNLSKQWLCLSNSNQWAQNKGQH